MQHPVSISHLRVLIQVNWKEVGKWSFVRFLKSRVERLCILQPLLPKNAANGRITTISIFLSEFYMPFVALFLRKDTDVIISWQMRIGVIYGILKRLFHHRKPPLHIVQDFHVDLTRNDWLYRARMAFMKLALPGIDFFCCTSTEEETIYSRMFGIPKDRILFLPLTPPSNDCQDAAGTRSDYIFSFGNSDRDYDTLIEAVAKLNIRTVILSQRYHPQKALPEHVIHIHNRISEKELNQWIVSSRMVIVPLKDYQVSAGQLSLLQVMALGRPVIVTRNMATREYAVHHRTALFYAAKDSVELADHIQYLWDHERISEEIGKHAKQVCSAFIDRRAARFAHLLEQCSTIIQKEEHK
jgi:glycosyltransferase involved in cell wall biosynthesis